MVEEAPAPCAGLCDIGQACAYADAMKKDKNNSLCKPTTNTCAPGCAKGQVCVANAGTDPLPAPPADELAGIGSLATIATTAPFIGLFGTVIGIINAFRGMASPGSGGIGAVSAGIAEALVTTALGLFVAIPAAWMFNYFTNSSSASRSRCPTRRPS